MALNLDLKYSLQIYLANLSNTALQKLLDGVLSWETYLNLQSYCNIFSF